MQQLLLSLLVIFCGLQTIAQNTGIGVGTTNPDPSAQLDVSSTSKGFLPPRMTKAQRNAIATPAAGLMVWCTDCSAGGELDMYNGTGWTSYKLTSIAPFGNVLICGQIWQGKNLDVSNYRNGDPIPKVTDAATWAALTTGAYCYYNNDSATYAATYGKLYNWYAVNDPRGLAPAGWHIPSDAEWTTLEACLGGNLVAGGAMKETGGFTFGCTGHWQSPNTGATNNSSFTGLPGGYRNYDGYFLFIGNNGYFWSSTEFSTNNAWFRNLFYNYSGVDRDGYNKQGGFSVRCLRD